jgi:hypothetical protein
MFSLTKRFFIGWLVSSLTMFGLSYVWHGLFTNDYQLINYPLGIYLIAAAIAYLFIGFLVSVAFTFSIFDRVSRHPLGRGPVAGFLCGILVYIIALVVQVTFNKYLDLKILLFDLTWQGIEQAMGGFAVGIVSMFVFEPLPEVQEE